MSCVFKRHLFLLDVSDSGIGIKWLADRDGVDSSDRGFLEDRLFGGVCVCGEDRAEQAICFSGAWRSPTERAEKVVVYNRAIERRVLKICGEHARRYERFATSGGDGNCLIR